MPTAVDGMKQCNKCHTTKPITDYQKNNAKRDGLFQWCRTCVRIQDACRKYSISPEQLNAMIVGQDNTCAICKVSFTNSPYCVDHCHNSKKVRGLLCQGCNKLLGNAQDDTAILFQAIEYLRTAGPKPS